MLLYNNSGRPLNPANERVCSLTGNSLSCLYWSSVMPSTMPDPPDPGATTSISLICRHAVFGFFQYEKGEVSPSAESRPDWIVALAKRGNQECFRSGSTTTALVPHSSRCCSSTRPYVCGWKNRNRSILIGMLASSCRFDSKTSTPAHLEYDNENKKGKSVPCTVPHYPRLVN